MIKRFVSTALFPRVLVAPVLYAADITPGTDSPYVLADQCVTGDVVELVWPCYF